MKIGITCGGIGPYASGDFLRRSIQAAERSGFAHYWIPDHVILFPSYPESKYPYAEGSGQELPDQDPDAPLRVGVHPLLVVLRHEPVGEAVVLQRSRAVAAERSKWMATPKRRETSQYWRKQALESRWRSRK